MDRLLLIVVVVHDVELNSEYGQMLDGRRCLMVLDEVLCILHVRHKGGDLLHKMSVREYLV